MLKHALTGALLALGVFAGPAAAADLDSFYGQPPEVEPEPDFTFGSGWYLRGDATATDDIKHHLGGLTEHGDRENWNYGVGGGAGYQFTSYLRADVTADYFGKERLVYADAFGDAFKSSVERYDVLGNAYLDLGTWGGFTPYVGAGVGFAGLYSKLEAIDGVTGESFLAAGQTRYNLAWAAMAGVAYHVAPNFLIDVGYRYLDLGEYTPIPGRGSRTLDSHQIRAGVRYMIF